MKKIFSILSIFITITLVFAACKMLFSKKKINYICTKSLKKLVEN